MNTSALLRLVPATALALGLLVSRADARSCCERDMPGTAASANSLYQLPLHFQDDQGRTVAFSDLRGHPVVIAMFFASCPSACPALVGELKLMQRKLPASVRAATRFVLVSFDSEHDRVPVLAAYRKSHGLDAHWTLLRGADRDVRQLAALLGISYQRQPNGMFRHTTVATALDANGDVIAARTGLGGSLAGLSEALARIAPPAAGAHPAS
ncbi:hypothetical protein GALL_260090 [mine drainage metagenome]|uniref:Thioredoxin domain-containing protein n=1 Tax=mine drainage metagenome TaxID=410659 RepID=A0A1J5R9R6_9ZZZZ